MSSHATSRESTSCEEGFGLLELEKPEPISRFQSAKTRYIGSSVSILRSLTSFPWSSVVRRGAYVLIPSFLQGPEARQQIRPAEVSQTAYLDGLRGLAALFVYFCHLCYMGFWVGWGWGSNGENYYLLKLPFIRLWAEGSGAVALFFVISGYALSYRPLRLMRTGSNADLQVALSSQTFRRAFRLFLPTIASTFLVVVMIRLGLYELTRDIASSEVYFHRLRDTHNHPSRRDSAWEQWVDWVYAVLKFANVFSWNSMNDYTNYDLHLWTIPLEFRCSLYLFLVLSGTARLQTRFRLFTVACCVLHCFRNTRWELMLFFFGMVIAEHDHARGAHVSRPAQSTASSKLSRSFWVLTSFLGLYFLSMPSYDAATTPGWVWLTRTFVPDWWPNEEECRIGQSVGAALFVIAVGHVGWWKILFNSFPIQYLGKISYSLYLMHGPALHAVGYHWFRLVFAVTGDQGHWYVVGYTLAAFFNVLTVFWWADVFWRVIDIPSVKFARWIESKVITKRSYGSL